MNSNVRKWSNADEELLMKNKDNIDEVSSQLKRSVGACQIRLKKIAARLHSEGLSFDDIEKQTGITRDVLEEQLKIDARLQNKKMSNSSALIRAKLKEIEAMLPSY